MRFISGPCGGAGAFRHAVDLQLVLVLVLGLGAFRHVDIDLIDIDPESSKEFEGIDADRSGTREAKFAFF